jgi:hypothetical protein
MVSRIRELEKLLGNNGIEVLPWQFSPYNPIYPPGVTFDNLGNPIQNPNNQDSWSLHGSVWVNNYQQRKTPRGGRRTFPRHTLESRPTDSHLGVGSDNAPLSSFKGTQLSILGTTIDITSFDAPDMDEPPPDAKIAQPLYNKSVQAFLQSTMNINPPLKDVPLPSREDAFTYANWYFVMIFPFLPVLHRPTFLKLVRKLNPPPPFFPALSSVAQMADTRRVNIVDEYL